MKIGILGGAFNPPHNGHLVIAKEAFAKLGLDKLFIIPTNISPHKNSENTSADLRLEMLKILVSDIKGFEVLDLEIKRGGVSYTVDTIKELKKQYTQAEFYLIIGSDLANSFFSWFKAQEIKELVKVVVAQRESFPLQDKDNFIILDITQVEVSSSQIRQEVTGGHSVEALTPGNINRYIKDHHLYKVKELK